MSEEILINVSPRETRVAMVEDGVLQEILLERSNRRGLVGNIYVGKVVRVLPGMQAAFVEIGLERAAFLHASAMLPTSEEYDSVEEGHGLRIQEELIASLLHEGQHVIVQVIKDPIGNKGARLTTRLSLPSRYLVFVPEFNRIGVSVRIEDQDERARLKALLQGFLESSGDKTGGFIIRTAAEGASVDAIQANYHYLLKLWNSIRETMKVAQPGDRIHEELPLELRVLRDHVTLQTGKIRIDDPTAHMQVGEFMQSFVPLLANKVELYTQERPLFDLYGVEEELQKALERKVALKCGGHVVFDQTEAMTTIDVNTGAFVGHRNVDETIFKTNLEAADAIAKQLRIRNLGGIIIIDFIDMSNDDHKQQVLKALEKALAKDHTKSTVSNVSTLGLVEMTRKRTRESLAHLLCESCATCAGRGSIKSTETVAYEIIRELMRVSKTYEAKAFLVLAAPAVVERMLEEEASTVAQLENLIEKPITFQVEGCYTQEQFDVVLQ